MFIAFNTNTGALQRSAMCLVRSAYIPLLTERDRTGIGGYKHVAPPEQDLLSLRSNEKSSRTQHVTA